jgi:hypothetical protein
LAVRWVLLVVAGALLFVAGLYLGGGWPERDAEEPAAGVAAEHAAPSAPTPRSVDRSVPPRPAAREEPPLPTPTEPEHPTEGAAPAVEGPPPPGRGASVALVIDDLGRSLEDVARLAALGVPITHAVLPFERRTPEVVSDLRRRGVEMIVHLPMEPSNGADPGPGALRLAMGRRELVRATRSALEAVPGAIGVNNHMGSKLSADRPSMDAVLRVIGRRGLYFLDSRTSAESVGYQAARALEVPAAERQVFLDPDLRPEAVRYQFRRLLEVARERGAAIAIGHPHPVTLAVLAEEVPLAVARGYRFVPVSYLLDRSSVAAR